MQLYVLPISGGYFPHQIGILTWLSQADQKPDIVLASSGGNVSAYVGMAGDWTVDGINNIIKYMSNRIFIKSWWPPYLFYLPSVLKGYFHGSMYNINQKFYLFFKTLFNTNNIKTTEIWSGTFNKSRGMTQLFCNQSHSESCIKDDTINGELLNYLPYTYTDGDTDTLARVCFASAAVPVVFPPLTIRGESHTDGGNSFSSPLTPMKDSLIKSLKNECIHITYITPHNINAPKTDICYPISDGGVEKMNLAANYSNARTAGGSMYSQGKYAINELITSLYLQDRMAGLDVVGITQKSLFIEKIVSFDQFINFQKDRIKSYQKSFMEIYPLNDKHISITDFNGQEILDIMQQQTHVGVRLWVQ